MHVAISRLNRARRPRRGRRRGGRSGQEVDDDRRLSLAVVSGESGAAGAVVGAGTADNRDGRVVRLLGQHSLKLVRPLGELDPDGARQAATRAAADKRADRAVDAGVVTADLVAEAKLIPRMGLALGEELGALLRGCREVELGPARLSGAAAREHGGRGCCGDPGAQAYPKPRITSLDHHVSPFGQLVRGLRDVPRRYGARIRLSSAGSPISSQPAG